MTTEVTTISEPTAGRKRRTLIKTIEKIVGAAASGPEHVRLRRLFVEAGIITKKRRTKS